MSVTQYIGARYVPIFADPADWTKTRTYEPLTIVMHEGNSFTSKQFVPKGIELENEDFWAETGSYNAQVEQYRREVLTWAERIARNETTVNNGIREMEDYEQQTTENVANYQQQTTNKVDELQAKYNSVIGRLGIVDDWELFAHLPAIGGNGYLNSIAIDPANGTLYACYYMGSGQSRIRKFENFESLDPDSYPDFSQEITIANNHCNSASILDGYLYCSEFNGNNITVVNLTTFAVEKQLNFGLPIRSCVATSNGLIVQFYYLNYLVKFYPGEDRFNVEQMIGVKKPINVNVEYVQDMHADTTGGVYRLLSDGNTAVSKPYIEVMSNYLDGGSIVVPITQNYNVEWEGLSAGNDYFYIAAYTNGTIYRSQQMKLIRPQAGQTIQQNIGAEFASSDSQFMFAQTIANNGLKFTKEGNVYHVPLPNRIANGIRQSNGESPLLGLSFNSLTVGSSTATGAVHVFPIRNVYGMSAALNSAITGNSTNGFWQLLFTARLNPTTDAIDITILSYRRYSADSEGKLTMTEYDASQLTIGGLNFRLLR